MSHPFDEIEYFINLMLAMPLNLNICYEIAMDFHILNPNFNRLALVTNIPQYKISQLAYHLAKDPFLISSPDSINNNSIFNSFLNVLVHFLKRFYYNLLLVVGDGVKFVLERPQGFVNAPILISFV